MLRFPLRCLLGCALLVLCASVAHADEVRLRNGDRYTGKVVSLAGGTLRFDTGHGTVNLPWGDVEMLDVTNPLLVTVRNNPPRMGSIRSVAGGGFVLEPYEQVVPMGDLIGLAHPQQFRVSGDANAGLQATGGNTELHSLLLNGDLVAQGMGNRYTFGASVNQASSAGVPTDDKASGSLRYDRFFSPQLYANANVLMAHDQFRDLRLRTAVGSALGYQVLNGARVKLRTELGYGYVNEAFATPDEQGDHYHAARDSVRLDVNVVGTRLSVFHQHDGFFGLIGSNRLFVQTHNGLRMVVIGGVVATIEYDLDYDRSALPGRKRTDHTVGLTFGYRFGLA